MAAEVIRLSKEGDPIIRADGDVKRLIMAKDKDHIIKEWFLGTKYKASERDAIAASMAEMGIYPEDWVRDRELVSGLYPDIQDPNFGARIYSKQEFYEARSASISALEGTDPCNASVESVFEKSPIQRLVSRFLNPATPYKGLLLYHGVGVGKTCTAISVAEEYLKVMSHSKVFIVVPQAISSGFKRTIFDPSKLQKVNGVWTSQQCTGLTYPNLAIQELLKKSKDKSDFTEEEISDAVDKKIRDRYFRFGYLQFANWIKKQLKTVPSHLIGDDRIAAENAMIERLFSDKLIIIDEAHNLRDAATAEADVPVGNVIEDVQELGDADIPGAAEDKIGGKQLTPLLKRIVKYSQGMRILLMSATPMYNKANEIVHLLNLLIVNDTKDDGQKKIIGDIFTKEGSLRKGGDIILRAFSQRYVSYMRGENPYTFPLRLVPNGLKPVTWPTRQKVGSKEKPIIISKEQKEILDSLPIVQVEPVVGSVLQTKLLKVLKEGDAEEFKGDTWVHLDVSNIVYPNGHYGHIGWESYFTSKLVSGYRAFQWKPSEEAQTVDDVFSLEKLPSFSPKIAKIVEKLGTARGISFVYSRYVKAGILPIAMALERQGWTRVFSNSEAKPLLLLSSKVSRQCAFCDRREDAHKGISDHTFGPACYVFLSGDNLLTPSFSETLAYASQWPKGDLLAPYGGRVKAILGSQITTEGLDLKCIRAVHILDPWYHLNRLEQIIGRGIRFCSHAELPNFLRNCIVYEYALVMPNVESPDLHAYRISALKAKAIGIVQREMKIAAMDCNLNIAGLIVRGAPPRRIIDAEGHIIEQYNIDDKRFTSSCDYMEECAYTCNPVLGDLELNTKTYSYHNAQRRLSEKELLLKGLFSKEDIAIPIETIRKVVYKGLPWEIVSQALVKILESPQFIIEREDGFKGRLILQNGFLVFQPIGIRSKQIPLAYRYSRAYSLLSRRRMMPKRGTVLGDINVALPVDEPVVFKNEPVLVDPVQGFNTWLTNVNDALSNEDKESINDWLPVEGIPSSSAWGWLLFHFQKVPEVKMAALQYYVDTVFSPEQRKQVLERILREGISKFKPELIAALKSDMFITTDIKGFEFLNNMTFSIESFCLQGDELGLCPGSFKSIINKELGNPVDVKAGAGDVFGFIVPRKDNAMVFKTLDKINSKRVLGAVGSDCSLASDLGGHRGRIHSIQSIIRASIPDLVPFVIDDTKREKKKKAEGRQERQIANEFNHIEDLSHVYVCIYMEALLRIMDLKKCLEVRWFLNAVEAARAGLKGR